MSIFWIENPYMELFLRWEMPNWVSLNIYIIHHQNNIIVSDQLVPFLNWHWSWYQNSDISIFGFCKCNTDVLQYFPNVMKYFRCSFHNATRSSFSIWEILYTFTESLHLTSVNTPNLAALSTEYDRPDQLNRLYLSRYCVFAEFW